MGLNIAAGYLFFVILALVNIAFYWAIDLGFEKDFWKE